MKIKLKTDLNNLKEGTELEIVDIDGIPVDRYWRNRLEDSKIDGCIEVLDKVKKVEEKIVNNETEVIEDKEVVEKKEEMDSKQKGKGKSRKKRR